MSSDWSTWSVLESKELKTQSKVFEKKKGKVLQIVSPSQSMKIIISFVCFLAQFINICSSSQFTTRLSTSVLVCGSSSSFKIKLNLVFGIILDI